MNERTTVNISTITVLKVLLILLAVVFLWAVRNVILLLVISIIISSAIDPLADYLQSKKIPRSLSVLFVYAVFLGLIILIISMLVPPIGQQFKVISTTDYYDSFISRIGIYRDNLNNLGIGKTIESSIRSFTGTFADNLLQTTRGIVTGFVSVITVLVISFYLTVQENGMKSLLKHLTPYKHQAYAAKLINRIQRKIGAWVLGQIILSAVIFGLTFIGLTLLKVEFALVLALIGGILEIVPFIGPFLSAIPAVFFAFLQSPALALAVIILYIVVQQLENHIVVPVVMSKSVGLSPVLIILGILVGGTLGGILGALIAVPIISGIAVFVNDVMEGEVNEEPG
ncbi:MAG TPA: AI-2E family transporter [Patescibacteria group bacterium]|jgi:predicted PurR-regulated permease PerM|nr:AI-2E family transporter [Patescibacteria group bacterium]